MPPIVGLLAVLLHAELSMMTSTTCTAQAAVLAAREPFGMHTGQDVVLDAVAVVVLVALLAVGWVAMPLLVAMLTCSLSSVDDEYCFVFF
jgi:hypothetical protein